MTEKAEVILEDNLFRLSRNSTGYWMWSRLLNYNIATKAKTEHDAYVEAIRMLSTSNHRLLAERNKLNLVVEKITNIIEENEEW